MIRFIAILTILASNLYGQESITTDNLKAGSLFKDSKSTEGVGLYCINHGLTTITSMVLLGEDQDQIIATIPIRSTYSTPKEFKNWLTVKWNPNGTMVAIQDSLDKHSQVIIYRKIDDGTFTRVTLPDMLKLEAGGRMGIDVSTIVSSGQEPDEWKSKNILMVKYRFKTKDGKLYRRTLPISVDDKGEYSPQ